MYCILCDDMARQNTKTPKMQIFKIIFLELDRAPSTPNLIFCAPSVSAYILLNYLTPVFFRSHVHNVR
jgi:hypothetical protein